MNKKGYFITATDTGVGKTIVIAGLLRYFNLRGYFPAAVKAVQTGDDQDIDVYSKTSDHQRSLAKNIVMPYKFEKPCSPHLASALENKIISVDKILDSINTLKKDHDVVLVEGAGGILVPLNETQTMLDLIKQTGFDVIVVADNKLGTINHTLLSIDVLRKNNINIKGIIVNNTTICPDDQACIRDENIQAIKKYGDISNIIEVPFMDNILEYDIDVLERIEKFIGKNENK